MRLVFETGHVVDFSAVQVGKRSWVDQFNTPYSVSSEKHGVGSTSLISLFQFLVKHGVGLTSLIRLFQLPVKKTKTWSWVDQFNTPVSVSGEKHGVGSTSLIRLVQFAVKNMELGRAV